MRALCKHRRMSSHDDPEARIRDLERSLNDRGSELTQSSSELGSGEHGAGYGYGSTMPPYAAPPHAAPPPYGAPQPPYGMPFPPVQMSSTGGSGRGWPALAVMGAVTVAIVVGAVVFFANVFSGVDSIIDTFEGKPTVSGGGGGPFGVPPVSGGNRPPAPTFAPAEPTAVPGGDISVAGVESNRSITCDDNAVNVSGVRNTVVLTGECRSVTVSGIENTVTVDSTATISASGFDNHITYLSGDPEIQNSGGSNVVERG
jgi:hypothetical protein